MFRLIRKAEPAHVYIR